jgi:hypothetical protein
MTRLQTLTENVWVARQAWSLLGIQLGKTTTVVRLADGRLVVHSAGPDMVAVARDCAALGEVGWLVDATTMHDTFAAAAVQAWPGVPYLVPKGFPLKLAAGRPLSSPPAEWGEEWRVLRLPGVPRLQEHVMLHRPSRTLILADVVFNLPVATGWTRFMLRTLSGLREHPGTSRLWRGQVKDRAALRRALDEVLTWDFERVVVGHGEPITTDARERLRRALAWLE